MGAASLRPGSMRGGSSPATGWSTGVDHVVQVEGGTCGPSGALEVDTAKLSEGANGRAGPSSMKMRSA